MEAAKECFDPRRAPEISKNNFRWPKIDIFGAMLGLVNLEEYFWKLQNEHFRASAWNAENEVQGEIIEKI